MLTKFLTFVGFSSRNGNNNNKNRGSEIYGKVRRERQQVLLVAEPPLQPPLCHFKSFSVNQVRQQELKKVFGVVVCLFLYVYVCECGDTSVRKANNRIMILVIIRALL